ncbi:hypothetical protein [Paenibacillus sp. NPDC057934]|uniref:hypothetical protein n=1 Tax=Paenibacillus sp. NPDC057934 TaxID=3346282 RepID=UPI0036DB9A2E
MEEIRNNISLTGKNKPRGDNEASVNLSELAEAAYDVLKEEVLPSPSDGNAAMETLSSPSLSQPLWAPS